MYFTFIMFFYISVHSMILVYCYDGLVRMIVGLVFRFLGMIIVSAVRVMILGCTDLRLVSGFSLAVLFILLRCSMSMLTGLFRFLALFS